MKKLPARDRDVARLFAELATIKQLEALTPGTRLVLVEQAARLFFPPLDLRRLYKGVHGFIPRLLSRAGQKVRVPLPLSWWLEDGELRQGIVNDNPQDTFWLDLFRLG